MNQTRTGWVVGWWSQVKKMMWLDVGHYQVCPDQVEKQSVESDWSNWLTNVWAIFNECSESSGKNRGRWTIISQFKKIVNESNVEIKKLAWTGLDKVQKVSSSASVSSQRSAAEKPSKDRLFFRNHSKWLRPLLCSKVLWPRRPKSWPEGAWPDKRCSRCYTLCGWFFADVQSHEMVKGPLQNTC